jgi:hypothetical protein
MTPNPENVTLTVTHRRSARRARDGWLEVERRNPETGKTWWERLRPLYPGETAEGMTIVPDQ